ncbi:hypothetical protein [Suicoccus acidiformans]|uniref:hypothetical protein n=1 Tax=Suicoccus acidiformans TaxID=2036206 RepID=UPI0013C34595|nr:hypothetical protein [Suicoccus acidiformans]
MNNRGCLSSLLSKIIGAICLFYIIGFIFETLDHEIPDLFWGIPLTQALSNLTRTFYSAVNHHLRAVVDFLR